MYPFIRGGIDLVELVPCDSDSELPAWCCPFYCWQGRYMVHRYIGCNGNDCLMLGDGNLARVEHVKRHEIIGLLRYIYYPDGRIQDCTDPRWLRLGALWYKVRFIRRFLLLLIRLFHLR